ncbi:MAG: hypothetical protein ACLFWL_09790 [Candidatus Brocadiia bacterium]
MKNNKRKFYFGVILLALFVIGVGCAERPERVKQKKKKRVGPNADLPADRDEFQRRVSELRKQLPEDVFTIIVQPPFVIIGDEEPGGVERRARKTVKWTVDMLRKAYFPRLPDRIIDVWLFKDRESYREHCRSLFHIEPGTPFGFCSREYGLIMNVATGGGTLVHEIVHPFVEANFPECPAWFNEGLASLYEQCGERGGRIVGFTNWRLAGLQKAIGRDSLGSFKRLTDMSALEFYGEGSGLNYAQARYLCYYLQEKGVLRKFFKKWTARTEADPTGYETLKSVLSTDDMERFQNEWEDYVMSLHFP